MFHPDVFEAIDGLQTGCVKSEWYDLIYPDLALVTARDKATHRLRRAEWKRGFSVKGGQWSHKTFNRLPADNATLAVAQYEEKILKYVDQLAGSISADVEALRIIDVRDLFYWFGFDMMGDFIFNKSFSMLEERKWHHIITMLQRALSLLGPFNPVPWAVQLGLRLLPRVGVVKDWHGMRSWSEQQMQERIEVIPNSLFDLE